MTQDTLPRTLWHEPLQEDPTGWPAIRLAYIGDAVFELYVRMTLAGRTCKPTGALHSQSVRIVSATAQAAAFHKIKDTLSETELAIVRRGRNAKPHHLPRHTDQAVYRLATGFEALLGYLYLSGQEARLAELCHYILEELNDGGPTETETNS